MTQASPWQALLGQLEQQRPRQLLYCGHEPQPALQEWCRDHHCQLHSLDAPAELSSLGRFDCVVIGNWLEHYDDRVNREFLARLRNLHSHSIWLLVHNDNPQPLAELLSLGFQRQQRFASGLEAYGYNLDRYNHQREWNSPRFWANPENWGKYWW